jgi:hypothetical protein
MKLPLKRICLLLIACFLVFSLDAQTAKVKQGKKNAFISKQELKEYVDKIHNEKVEQHLKIQTKSVQKRLKQSQKETDANYNRLNFKSWWSGLFNKNSRRKSKNK